MWPSQLRVWNGDHQGCQALSFLWFYLCYAFGCIIEKDAFVLTFLFPFLFEFFLGSKIKYFFFKQLLIFYWFRTKVLLAWSWPSLYPWADESLLVSSVLLSTILFPPRKSYYIFWNNLDVYHSKKNFIALLFFNGINHPIWLKEENFIGVTVSFNDLSLSFYVV